MVWLLLVVFFRVRGEERGEEREERAAWARFC